MSRGSGKIQQSCDSNSWCLADGVCACRIGNLCNLRAACMDNIRFQKHFIWHLKQDACLALFEIQKSSHV